MAVGRIRLLTTTELKRGAARAWLVAPLCLILGVVWTAPGWGASLWPEEQQRLRVGLKIFPATLGAQQGLAAKRGSDGKLRVVVVYHGADEVAHQVAASLDDVGTVQGMPLTVRILPTAALDSEQDTTLAAIFVASVGIDQEVLRRLGALHQTLVFSPFAGDVAAGASAGIHVTDRILPAVNLRWARRAGVRFKPFFMKVVHRVD